MNQNLEQKLKTYSALAAGVIATTGVVNAQIIYTDVSPDNTMSDSSLFIDLNNDKVPDFSIVHMKYGTGTNAFFNLIGLQSLNKNEILGDTVVSVSGSSTSTNFYPKALNQNELIDDSQELWFDSKYGQMYLKVSYGTYQFEAGEWPKAVDKFLGLRFKINGVFHYGWVRLDMGQNAASFTVKDYAYESHPGKKILAGQSSSGIVENGLKDLSLYALNKTLFITLISEIHYPTAIIYNTLGKEMMNIDLHNGNNEVDLSDFASGVYIFNLISERSVISRKFIVK